MSKDLYRHTRILDIVGDIIRVRAPNIPLGELGLVENVNGERSMACVIELNREVASLQLFAGAKGYSTGSTVRFLGTPMQVTYSPNILEIGRAHV